jgi:hypothetical protein
MPRLFARRTLWVPTVWGWLLLLAVLGGGLVVVARSLHSFLAVTDPVGARVLVVEGTIQEEELDQAVALFRKGGYERIVTTGGPVGGYPGLTKVPNFAEFAAGYLRAHGLADARIDAVPAPASAQDRTFLCAVMLREWARREGVALDAIDLVSSGPHARRSRSLFQSALGEDVRVGIVATEHPEFDGDSWWSNGAGAKHTVIEALNWAWVALFFRAPPAGSHEERWAVPRRAEAGSAPATAAPRPDAR